MRGSYRGCPTVVSASTNGPSSGQPVLGVIHTLGFGSGRGGRAPLPDFRRENRVRCTAQTLRAAGQAQLERACVGRMICGLCPGMVASPRAAQCRLVLTNVFEVVGLLRHIARAVSGLIWPALVHDREAERSRRGALASGVGGCDQHRVTAWSEFLRVRDAPLERELVQAAVARRGERGHRDLSLTDGLAAIRSGGGDAPTRDAAPAHLLHEGKTHARRLVEDEGELGPDRNSRSPHRRFLEERQTSPQPAHTLASIRFRAPRSCGFRRRRDAPVRSRAALSSGSIWSLELLVSAECRSELNVDGCSCSSPNQ